MSGISAFFTFYPRSARAIIVLIGLLSGSTMAQSPEQAEAYVRAGNTQAGISEYQKILALEPESLPVLHRLAELHGWRSETGQVIVYLERIIALDPLNPEVLHRLSDFYRWNDQPLKSISSLERYVALKPDDKDALKLLANMYDWNALPDEAIRTFRKLTILCPDSLIIRRNLARRLVWQNQQQQAITEYEKIITQDKTDLFSIRQLAQLYTWNSRPGNAAPLFERLHAERPGDDSLLFSLAQAQYYSGNWSDAQKSLTLLRDNKAPFKEVPRLLEQIEHDYASTWQLDYNYLSDSNQLHIVQIPFMLSVYQNSNWHYRLRLLRRQLDDQLNGVMSASTSLNTIVRYSFTRVTSLETIMGIELFDHDWKSPGYGIQLEHRVSDQISLRTGWEMQPLRGSAMAADRKITSNQWRTECYFQPTGSFQLSAVYQYDQLSDSNRKNTVIFYSRLDLPLSAFNSGLYASWSQEDYRTIFASSRPYWTPDNLQTRIIGADISGAAGGWLDYGVAAGFAVQGGYSSFNFRWFIKTILSRQYQLSSAYDRIGSAIYQSDSYSCQFNYTF
jgi:Flp pilus assembly protein TadD